MGNTDDRRETEGLDAALAQLEALLGQPHVADDYVRFRIDLARAQHHVQQGLAGGEPTPAATGEELSIDQELLAGYFSALCATAARNGGTGKELAQLRAAAAAEPALLTNLVRQAGMRPDQAYLDQLAARLQVSAEGLQLVAHMLAAPFVAHRVLRAEGEPTLSRDTAQAGGSCPYCASSPALARLRRDDGKRFLICSLCGGEWEFPRVRCPFCGSEDQRELNVLLIDDTNKHWVETCELCKHYLKCLRESEYPEDAAVIPFVEETATLYLDILAGERGYARRLPCAVLR
jgi:formate dehydrogenase accessory protein FdhE